MIRYSLLIAGAALLVSPAAVQAQSSSLFGNRGVTGTTGTLNNGVGGNRSGTGASAAGNSGSMSGFSGATAGQQTGFLSGAQSSGGLAGTGNGQFVGNRNSAAARAAGGQAGAGGAGGARSAANGGRNALGGGLSRNNNGQRNRANQNGGASGGAQSTPIRPVLVIAFDPPAKTGENIATSINSDLSSAVSQGRLPDVAVNADAQGIVTLSGHVPTESDRRKAERMVRLEPGVRDVVNRITVQEQAAQ